MTTQTDPTMQVLDAIRADYNTSKSIQEMTGLSKSATDKILKALTADGQVTKTAGPGKFSAATYAVAAKAAKTPKAAPKTAAKTSKAAADATATAAGTETTPAAATAATGGVTDVAAWMESERPTPTPTEEELMAEQAKKDKPKKEPKTPKEPKTGRCTHPGCEHPDMHKEGRSWLHNPVEGWTPDHTATSRAVRVATPSDGTTTRRAAGGMGEEIVAWLQDPSRRDQSFGPGAIARGIGTQWSGTVGKQCEKLVASGHILKTAPSPGAKYQAA